MKRYIVSIPITGAIHVEVEAEDKHEAREVAWCKVDNDGEDAGEVEWEFVEHVTEGNVTHAYLNDIEVSEVKP